MIKLSHEEKWNRVTLAYEGNVDAREAEELYLKLLALIPKCSGGFKLLVDLSLLDKIETEVLPFIKKIMDLFNQHGISEVVRIIPDPSKDIGFSILSIFHYDKDVQVLTCQSLEQAHEHYSQVSENISSRRASPDSQGREGFETASR